MPITVTVQGKELYDQASGKFISTKTQTITMEHSLVSIARWEAKWHKPYLSREQKTKEELYDYFRCMTITQNVPMSVYYAMDLKTVQQIVEYIQDPNTAHVSRKSNRPPSKEIITNELVYYWMTVLNIPFDPCEKWHFQHLMTLIEVCSQKQQPPSKKGKKMPSMDAIHQRSAMNAARRAKYNTRG